MFISESLLLLPDFGVHACKSIRYPEVAEICLAFTEISLLYTSINQNDRKLVISLPPDTRSSTRP